MLLTALVLALLSSAIAFCLGQRRSVLVCSISQLLLFSAFIISLLLPVFTSIGYQHTYFLSKIDLINITLSIRFDALSWLMLSVVTLISLLIHSYSSRYLMSDSNQSRFIAQLSLLTTSVMLLIVSGNLFTTFVAWQLIGFSLYLLLNHYHYDVRANKAAKKKFMINRIGDLCFLTAVVLTFIHYGTTDFATILSQYKPVNNEILLLIFVAVMAKSAQFPFHIWLIDTMEAPTPVSALMHAGIINAGGYLLARMSPWYSQSLSMLVIIFMIGITTALLGKIFMSTQVDVKKRLAYSTMGQMGYMIMQCGLGCFTSAVFHLIAHGFFKSTLFLSSASTLTVNNVLKRSKKSSFAQLYAVSLAIVVCLVGYGLMHQFYNEQQLSLLIWFFLAFTLYEMFYAVMEASSELIVKLTLLALLIIIFLAYIAILVGFISLLNQDVIDKQYPIAIQLWIVLAVAVLFLIAWLYKPFNRLVITISLSKAKVESAYRQFIINPLRGLGDKLLIVFKIRLFENYLVLTLLIVWGLIPFFVFFSDAHNYIIAINLLILTLLLIAVNRENNLDKTMQLMLAVVVYISNVALLTSRQSSIAISYFHIINLLPIVIGSLLLLYQGKSQKQKITIQYNRLPWRHFYLSAFLMLLIGIPGSASFITELYIFKQLLYVNLFTYLMFALSIWLLALIVLHALQMHFFNPNAISYYTGKLPVWLHAVSIMIILFNIYNGIVPSVLIDSML